MENSTHDSDKMYENMDLYNDSIEKLSQHRHEPISWVKWLRKYRSEKNQSAVRSLRISVQEGTNLACERGKYKMADGTYVKLGETKDIAEDIKNNLFYKDTPPMKKDEKNRYNNMKVEVIEGDCLEAAIQLLSEGLNPAVLNMASPNRPGGGYKNGAGAQEENLFRRTNYRQHLESFQIHKLYPLPEFSGIYSPNVLVFRSSEDTGYAFLPSPQKLSFIAVAAYARPATVKGMFAILLGATTNLKGGKGELELAPKMADKTKQKIRTILSIALDKNHDSIVLSGLFLIRECLLAAFGCGAYANPPKHIAKLFHEVISKEYAGCFKKIVFAIIDDENARKKHNPLGNVQPFRDIFATENKSQHRRVKKESSALSPSVDESILASETGKLEI